MSAVDFVFSGNKKKKKKGNKHHGIVGFCQFAHAAITSKSCAKGEMYNVVGDNKA